MLSTLAQVRSACRVVANQAQHVSIRWERVPGYAEALPLSEALQAEMDWRIHFRGDDAETAAFFLTLDAINFGSGYFPAMRMRHGLSGYATVAASLTDYYRAHGPLSAAALARLSAGDCAAIFAQDPTNPAMRELMELFAAALRELGSYTLERFDGQLAAIVTAAGGSAERLVELLANMSFYRDVATYNNIQVPLYKRAQISVADLALAFGGQGYGAFSDLDRLTIFADNQVPHVLRSDGLLQYSAALAARVDQGLELPPGSQAEVEIRACAVHAVELLVAALRSKGRDITARQLDFLLWNRGEQLSYSQAGAPHYTKTVFY